MKTEDANTKRWKLPHKYRFVVTVEDYVSHTAERESTDELTHTLHTC